jgi:AhpD family alkylhydroperoxidase
MSQRLNPYDHPQVMAPLMALEEGVKTSGLERSLIELVKTRASQINGCAFCINMHTHDAIAAGESPKRLFLLDAWREAPVFSERERAALAWTEALTRIADTHAPEADFETLKAQFSPEEQLKLTLLIGAINVWNRLAIGFRIPPPGRPPG